MAINKLSLLAPALWLLLTAQVGVNEPADFATEAARGRISGAYTVNKFGANAAIPNGSAEPIWSGSTAYAGWLTAAETVRIKAGGNAADTVAGAGARQITIEGLDETWSAASETVATAGASASAATTTTFFRVFRAKLTDTGAGTYHGSNTAAIVIEGVDSSAVLARIEAGLGQTEMALYSVPVATSCYLLSVTTTLDTGKAADFSLWRVEAADTVAAPFSGKRNEATLVGLDAPLSWPTADAPICFPEKTDLWMEAAGNGGVASVTARFKLQCFAGSGAC